jgi:hypothetical protein
MLKSLVALAQETVPGAPAGTAPDPGPGHPRPDPGHDPSEDGIA